MFVCAFKIIQRFNVAMPITAQISGPQLHVCLDFLAPATYWSDFQASAVSCPKFLGPKYLYA